MVGLPGRPRARHHRGLRRPEAAAKTYTCRRSLGVGTRSATGSSLRLTVRIRGGGGGGGGGRRVNLIAAYIGSVKLDQIFRGAPNSPVSLLNKASICSTGLTPKVSENLSSTTFTINKDNSLTLTPVPIPPAANRAYYDEPRYHRVEFTPRSTPGLEYGTQGSESAAGDEGTQQWREPEVQGVTGSQANVHGEGHVADGHEEGPETGRVMNGREEGYGREERRVVDGRDERRVVDGKEYEQDGDGCSVGEKPLTNRGYQVFVPKAHKTYEEYVPNVNAYTEPGRTDSRCSLKSPSSFRSAVSDRPKQNVQVIQERSLPVRALIDSFEHNGRPVMRYLQPDESIPLSDGIRHLHDDQRSATVDDGPVDDGGFYTADAVVETRSFAYGTDGGVGDDRTMGQPVDPDETGPVDETRQVDAEGSGASDRSEYGDTDVASMPSFDVRGDHKFQTIRQLATPDSLESSMLFAQKHTSSERDNAATYYGPTHTKVAGKTNDSVPTFGGCFSFFVPLCAFSTAVCSRTLPIGDCPFSPSCSTFPSAICCILSRA